MDHGSVGRMGHNFGRVTWVMGRRTLIHDPLLVALYFGAYRVLRRSVRFLQSPRLVVWFGCFSGWSKCATK